MSFNNEFDVLTRAYRGVANYLTQEAGMALPFPDPILEGKSPEIWFNGLTGRANGVSGNAGQVPVCVYAFTVDCERETVSADYYGWASPVLTSRGQVVLYKKVYEKIKLLAADDNMCVWVRPLKGTSKCEVVVVSKMPIPNCTLKNRPSSRGLEDLVQKHGGKSFYGVRVADSGPLDLTDFTDYSKKTGDGTMEPKTSKNQSNNAGLESAHKNPRYARKLSDVEVKGRKAQGDGKYSASDPAQLERLLSNQGVTPEMVQNLSDTVIGMMDQLIQEVQLTGRADPHFWNAEARQRMVQSLSHSLNIPA